MRFAARNRSAPGVATAGKAVCALHEAAHCAASKRERLTMEFFCLLDAGMDQTSICVVAAIGKVMLEAVVVTDPDAIRTALAP